MPRPRRWRALRITSFYIPIEYEEIMKQFEEIASREGKSVSLLLLDAVTYFLSEKYPGNPQPPLESFTPNGLKPKRLEAKFVAKEVSRYLGVLEKPKISKSWRNEIKSKRLPPLLIKLARLNQRLRDEEYNELIEEGAKKMGLE